MIGAQLEMPDKRNDKVHGSMKGERLAGKKQKSVKDLEGSVRSYFRDVRQRIDFK